MKIPHVKTAVEYTAFAGGLDQESPSIKVVPGKLLSSQNYVPASEGGYERIDGYERYSGQPSPSDAEYYRGDVTITGAVAIGDTVTGVTSSATGVVCSVYSTYINITKITGVFEIESLTVSAVVQGSFTEIPILNNEASGVLHATALNDAATQYRTDISAPAGSGRARGFGLLDGVLYAFRDNAGATAGNIFKATATGWDAVTLYKEISFGTGLTLIADGTAITQLTSGATATVKRAVLETGAWGSDAAGRLILSDITGTFDATHEIQVSAATVVTATSLVTDITILPGGEYRTVTHNFFGTESTRRIYGADGVNPGFEFDGDVYIQLNSGMDVDTPTHVYAHKKQLFLSFEASSQNSGVGTPYEWTAVSGALEIAMGDTITGYATLPGDALAIFSRNESSQLLGNNVSDYQLDSISKDSGCIPGIVQSMGTMAVCLDDKGIAAVAATDTYGNFNHSTLSRLIQKAIDTIKSKATASTVYRTKNQFRIYADDGTGVCMTRMDKYMAFSTFTYPDNIVCAISGEDSTGTEVVFIGDDEGMVYQCLKGSSFDGEDIESFMIPVFNNSKGPTTRKTYRKAVVEMTAELYSTLRVSPYMSYGDAAIAEHLQKDVVTVTGGGLWDVSTWDEFFYDSTFIGISSISVSGTGTNISLIIYSKSAIDFGHKIDGMIFHYTPRRLQR